MDKELKRMLYPPSPPVPRAPEWEVHIDPSNEHRTLRYHVTISNGKKIGDRIKPWIRWGKRNSTFTVLWRQRYPGIGGEQMNTYIFCIESTPAKIEQVYYWFKPNMPAQIFFEPCARIAKQKCAICDEHGE